MTSRLHRVQIGNDMAARISALHPELKRRIRTALMAIRGSPEDGKALTDELTGLWSWRVGRFRIVYRVLADRVVDIVTVGPRHLVYEEASHLAKQRIDA